MKMFRNIILLMTAAYTASLPAQSGAQLQVTAAISSDTAYVSLPAAPTPTYKRPSQTTMLNNFFFDATGPYALVSVAIDSGIGQLNNSPPEWKQGVAGYGRRFGSDYGISAVSTTTRYALSEAFREDPLYYRCDCTGALPRLSHTVVSILTARRGEDGHRVFSLPALVGSYAGSMTAVYVWYPNRFGAKDAFRIGNYSLLEYGAENIALEFFHVSPHSFVTRTHFNNRHGSPEPGTTP